MSHGTYGTAVGNIFTNKCIWTNACIFISRNINNSTIYAHNNRVISSIVYLYVHIVYYNNIPIHILLLWSLNFLCRTIRTHFQLYCTVSTPVMTTFAVCNVFICTYIVYNDIKYVLKYIIIIMYQRIYSYIPNIIHNII